MKAILRGQFLKMDSYYSKKLDKEIPVLVLFDGEESVRVGEISNEYSFSFGDEIVVAVRVFNGQYGLRIVFDHFCKI